MGPIEFQWRDGPDIALAFWATQAQEGLKGEHSLCSLMLSQHSDAECSFWSPPRTIFVQETLPAPLPR